MTTIIADAGLRAKLAAAGDIAEFRDEAGNLIGRYTAVSPDVIDVTDEELDRRERQEPRFSADQVLDRLRSLRR